MSYLVLSTDYCLNKKLNNFSLRRLFYSRKGLKNICCFFIYTSYKETNSIELIMEKSLKHIYIRWYILKVLIGFNVIKITRLPVICKSTHPEIHPYSEVTSKLYKPTFLTICFMVVLQSSGYFVFHSGDTPIQLSFPW